MVITCIIWPLVIIPHCFLTTNKAMLIISSNVFIFPPHFFSLPRSISFHPKYIKYLLLTATTDVLVFILTKLVIVDWPNCFNNWSEVITRMSVDPTTSNNQTNNQELSNLVYKLTKPAPLMLKGRKDHLILSLHCHRSCPMQEIQQVTI